MTDRVAVSPAIAPSDAPNPDCFDCAPDYQPLRDAIADGDFERFDGLIRAWSADDATRALFHLGEHDAAEFREFCEAHVGRPSVSVANAYREMNVEWRIRSNAKATPMSQRAFTEARGALIRAETILIEVCAVDPGFVPAWTARVLSARLLGLSLSETRRRYERVVSLGGDFWAQMHYHQYLEPTWFGSVDAAREFVDSAVAQGEDGSLSGVLLALFHLERCAEFGGPAAARAYLRRPEVQSELDAAAQSSVQHPSRSTLTSTVIYGHQLFVTAYWLADQKAKAARHRATMGERTSYENWSLLGEEPATQAAVWRELQTVTARSA